MYATEETFRREQAKLDWTAEAKKYDARFDGFQRVRGGKELPMFTHKLYGTFVVTSGENLPQAILRKQKLFATGCKTLFLCITCDHLFPGVDEWNNHRSTCNSTGLTVVLGKLT